MSKPFNVTVIQPPNYLYSMALQEAAEYLHASLQALGHTSYLSVNGLSAARINIVFCAHLLNAEDAARLPADTIIFNSEQLDNADGWYLKTGVYQKLLQRHYVWDYSGENLNRIPHNRKSFIPFAYCDALVRKNYKRRPGNSLLFYGVPTERRRKIIRSIEAAGVPVTVISDAFGHERDTKLFKARALLNLHNADHTTAFEQIRCFYPLINKIPVISESNVDDLSVKPFEDAVFFFDTTNLAKGCAQLFKSPAQFEKESARLLANYAARSGLDAISQAVQQYFASPVALFPAC